MNLPERIESLAVIGARGQMGRIFEDACARAGVEFRPLNRPFEDAEVAKALDGVHALMLSVPVTAIGSVLEAVAPHLGPTTILTDNCSVKVKPMGLMLKAFSGPMVGTHPLFGASLPNGFKPRVAVCPGRYQAAARLVSDLINRLGFEAFDISADNHDRAVAFVQSLNFTTNVAYLACMRDLPEITQFVTPSFLRRLDSARKMLMQDKDLFVAITEDNPFSQESVRLFRAFLSIAAGGDWDLLAERAMWWWRDNDLGGVEE